MLLWGVMVWFACPEWGLAYIQPKKPLTDLLQDEQSSDGKASDEKEDATEIFDQIQKKADGTVIERITELKKEARSLIQERQQLDLAGRTTSISVEQGLRDLATYRTNQQ